MTDDERMDRARRIREMREGSRPDDEVQDDDRVDADDDSPDSVDEPTVDESAGSVETTETAGTDDDGGPAADDGSAEAVAAGDSDDQSAEPTETAESVDDAVSEAAAEAVADLDVDEDAVGGGGGADTDDGDGTIHIPGADVGDVDVDVEEMARQAGLSSTESTAGDGEPADGAGSSEMGIGAAGRAAEQETGEETRVLEFTLGDEQYCLDIEYVEEIVKRETVTRVPNTPDCVEGVVDLRGQITTILDPKVLLDISEAGSKDLIVVFDPDAFDDQGAVGWVVDDVNQVTPITEEEVNDSPVDQDHINGVVDRDGEFVIWTTPELDLDEVAG
ncbi:purine-binding chemotaxis protein CheW [Halosimplex litoreum]|uniref:Purine-binding chemotaxis protein CheW n=1 Tax=Halosimplex litoreum TaxID=1198301 RepID=A0A7T3KW45_9EURY|nr:chemotaxis protein CheW [Halosimplex litoreum]QPV63658.1 purine-binding chemotaxis protein CheW [Halosimplex litoreum]